MQDSFRPSRASRPLATLLLASLAMAALQPSQGVAQQLSSRKFKNGGEVRAVFSSVIKEASTSTVQVRSSGKDSSLAAIVDKDGMLLTKGSELKPPITCVIRNKVYPAKILGIHRKLDLALLKVSLKNLKPVKWSDKKDLPAGRWVATTDGSDYPRAIGSVSVARRKIPTSNGVLGIAIENDPQGKGVLINHVFASSAAAKAGLRKNDVITRVGDKVTQQRETLVNTIRQYQPGDTVVLSVIRASKKITITAMLGTEELLMMAGDSEGEAFAVGKLSSRRGGFGEILQHDTVLKPSECGGPAVDLTGKVIGINIARAGRTASYMLPVDVVRGALADLMAGKHATTSAKNKK